MQSQWKNEVAETLRDDLSGLRDYAAQLLRDADPTSTVNCSVKKRSEDVFGDEATLLSLSEDGSETTVDNERLIQLSRLDGLTPEEQRTQLNQSTRGGENPAQSLSAYWHAVIPTRFVFQIRSSTALALAHHPSAGELAASVFGPTVRAAAKATPGIKRAKAIEAQFDSSDDAALAGILVPGTGLLVFHDDPKLCYEQTLSFAAKANAHFDSNDAIDSGDASPQVDLMGIATLRKSVSSINGQATVAISNTTPSAEAFAQSEFASSLGLVNCDDPAKPLSAPPPVHRVAVKGAGIISFGSSKQIAQSLADETRQVCQAYQLATAAGGWAESLPEPRSLPALNGTLQGKIALVSGSAAGIGLATATTLTEAGACVVGADINPEIESIMEEIGALGIAIDLTQEPLVKSLVERVVQEFGGLDIVVSNAGIFTAGAYLEDMDPKNWERSLAVNLTSHQVLMKHAIPFVKKGVDPTIIFIGSRNVNAPGAGAASYSCAKAGLTQLCRVAALELAPEGVRVNIIHPDAVFDTKLWTKEALERSAERYGLTVEQYKKRNLMKTEITSRSVGNTVVALASDAFAKTTGAQIPVDGGNDRII